MIIKDVFTKPIDRELKSVIKVEQNDEKTIYQELDEYVVTKELNGHFQRFFENYCKSLNTPTDNMGVWIKGFFGSGKSHFLKILAYTLENREICGRKAVSFFTDGSKISDNFIVANIKAASQKSPEVILFDIDAKSAQGNREGKDYILDVFVRVFNEHLGYCGPHPFIADLEEKLTDDGIYSNFKDAFKGLNGNSWEDSRNKHAFVQKHLKAALTKIGFMTEEEVKTWYETESRNYSITIEDFAKRIRKYCDKMGDNHRVVFLVDEMGQYIGDNSKLMLNLQTLVHNLGTQCQGKVWVIVTSQQDIDSITNVKDQDFSKILGRFDTRLSLTSANVDEVIRLRLLSKTNEAVNELKEYYDQKASIIKNLIVFTGDTAEMKLYANRDDFAAVYPFVPYQFNLLGRVLNAIREHGASGKHLSEGERSMLGLFSDAAISVKNEEIGALVSFNKFYKGLDDFLDTSQSNVISKARDNEKLEKFDEEVLKTLFMLKYVKEIKTNTDNLTTLLVSSVDEDRTVLQSKIASSLKRLEHETLIQKNGSVFEFLTADEQDINRAISRETVDEGEITTEISEFIFGDVLADVNKANGPNNKYVYEFNRKVDDKFYKNTDKHDLNLVVITPAQNLDPEDVRRYSAQNKGYLYVRLKDDGEYRKEIAKSIQIQKYLRMKGAGNTELQSRKGSEVIEIRSRVKIYLTDSLQNADIYISGSICDDIRNDSPDVRIRQALSKLVEDTYYKLSLMCDLLPSTSDIRSALEKGKQTNLDDNNPNEAAVSDAVEFVRKRGASHQQTTLKDMLNYFSKMPYGFRNEDISWLAATAFSENRILLKYYTNVLRLNSDTIPSILNYLTKKDEADKLVIEIRTNVSKEYIQGAKEVLREFYNFTPENDREDYLMDTFCSKTKDYILKLESIRAECQKEKRLPGLSEVEAAIFLLNDASSKDNQFTFFTYLNDQKEKLIDAEYDLHQVVGFYEGKQIGYFKKALDVLDSATSNSTYLQDYVELNSLVSSILDIVKLKYPYAKVNCLKDLNEKFNTLFLAALDGERNKAVGFVETGQMDITEYAKKKGVSDEFADNINSKFLRLRAKIGSTHDFGSINNVGGSETPLVVNQIAEEIDTFVRQKEAKVNYGSGVEPAPVDQGPKTVYVNISELHKGLKSRLESEGEVDEYLADLKRKILQKLGDDIILVIR